MSGQTNGIDVSHFQGNVDWGSVASGGIDFAFAKATEGTAYVDPKFSENWSGMGHAGLIRGAYFFYDVGTGPEAQAKHFIATTGLGSGDLPPVVDIESMKSGIESNAQLIKDLKSCVAVLKAEYGSDPILYSSPGFWNAHFDASFGDCPLWVAEYGVSTPKPVTGWRYWSFWQHSQSGKASGVGGNVDLDVFNGGLDQLKKFRLS